MDCDLHTHTKYSDGKSSIDSNALMADIKHMDRELDAVAITDHFRLVRGMSGARYRPTRGTTSEYLREIGEAREGVKVTVLSYVHSLN